MLISVAQNTRKEKFSFRNRQGQQLAALLELPPIKPAAYALFAHCFTCSKDIAAATRISKALAQRGFGVLRFDFTGIGNSEGDFANTNFSSNVQDLLDAAKYLGETHAAPKLLIGHSLGGAAVLSAAGELPEVTAVATIGAPSDPGHVAHLFADNIDEIESKGEANVLLAGRPFRIKKQFIDDINGQTLSHRIGAMDKALLVLHSPVDDIVGIDNAASIYKAAQHPKSFVSLDSADHLLSKPIDSEYTANIIANWAQRYILNQVDSSRQPLKAGDVLVAESNTGKFTQHVMTQKHDLVADEPIKYGSLDAGPSPYEFLLIALGACTSMTMRMYAQRKGLNVENISVLLEHANVHADDCADCETSSGKLDEIKRHIKVTGDLTEEQRKRILEIADMCPVHKTLHSEVKIRTYEAESSAEPA